MPQLTKDRRWKLSETLGRWGGDLLAPLVGLGAALRQARFFHPEGLVYVAQVQPLAFDGPLALVAKRLSGTAVVRLSNAWWRGGREWKDALGIAVRILAGDGEVREKAAPGDQDILFATIRYPITTLLAPLTTNTHDFLLNDYYAVSPFEVAGYGRGKLRLVASRFAAKGADRAARLEQATREGRARFALQIRPTRGGAGWQTVAEIVLERSLELDQQALRFSPFQDGRGVRPRGFVHSLRVATYGASRKLGPTVH